MNPMILTFTGKHVDPTDLQPEDIDIEDIAHALSWTNRFNGHARRGISVAQHSVFVSRLIDENYGTGDIELGWIALQGLLHDGSEAYLGDITKWLKNTPEFAGYRAFEEKAQTAIYQRFGCDTEQHPLVSAADKLMLRFEGEQAFGKNWAAWTEFIKYEPITMAEHRLVGPWSPWSARQSEEAFFLRFRSLQERLGLR